MKGLFKDWNVSKIKILHPIFVQINTLFITVIYNCIKILIFGLWFQKVILWLLCRSQNGIVMDLCFFIYRLLCSWQWMPWKAQCPVICFNAKCFTAPNLQTSKQSFILKQWTVLIPTAFALKVQLPMDNKDPFIGQPFDLSIFWL